MSAVFALAVEVTAYGAFAVLSAVLTVIDLRTHRLPDRLVLPAYPVAAVLLTGAAFLRGDPARLLSVAGGAIVLFAFYLLLRMLRPGAMGGGDVKLAGVIGAFLGYLGWDAVLGGAIAGFVFGGLVAAVIVLARRARGANRLAFGPWMLLGAWTAILATAATAVS
ncbi:leader peptidase (prepilin peptidase)/N-methyltransferase [Microbacterium sp. AG1240]|uniref:prepilin peptidase n=1 Tax=Microbacterium sp. AG1240 TaxID=2183992 RepID=UPI000EB00978|nr:A24 family peptidase [Microbacterium sp. AG1240]RKT31128.1 leader peptidase (prepilin peptidase)/N-methyltransferase [Microbacterium sp. AG1240]